jgi:hypothetical protein
LAFHRILIFLSVVSASVASPQQLDANVRNKIDSLPFLLKDSVNAFNTKLFR